MMAHSEQGHKRMENSLDFSVIGAHPGGRNLRQQCNDRPADAGRADREAGPNSTIRSLARTAHSSKSGKRNPAYERMEGWKGGSFPHWFYFSGRRSLRRGPGKILIISVRRARAEESERYQQEQKRKHLKNSIDDLARANRSLISLR